MKEQPQKPESIWDQVDALPDDADEHDLLLLYRQHAVQSTSYISHLEQENTALKESRKEVEELRERINKAKTYVQERDILEVIAYGIIDILDGRQ